MQFLKFWILNFEIHVFVYWGVGISISICAIKEIIKYIWIMAKVIFNADFNSLSKDDSHGKYMQFFLNKFACITSWTNVSLKEIFLFIIKVTFFFKGNDDQ